MSSFQSVRDSDGGRPNADTNFFDDILKLFANTIIEFPYITGIMLRNGAWKNIHYWCTNEDGLAFVGGFIGTSDSDEAKGLRDTLRLNGGNARQVEEDQK